MKFDCIVLNPPYQTKSEASVTKTQVIWDKFVSQSVNLLNPDGYLCVVHPSGWRNIDGKFKNLQELLLSKNIEYLELHDQPDGVKTFGAKTDYDWYILKNSDKKSLTKIVGHDKNIYDVNISDMKFIPNGQFDKIKTLIAKEGEEKVEIINNSAYHTQRPHMAKEKSDEFKYPCAYTTMKKGMVCWYSNVNTTGHFKIPKLIWGQGEVDYIGSEIDKTGKYGLTQFCSGLVDLPENLDNIKKAFDSEKFKEIMNMCVIGKFSINHKIFATFRKDWWKEFVNENGKEI
jgi:hypothetical protein